MFKMLIHTDNDAFREDRRDEVARILRDVADNLSNGYVKGPTKDSNGQTVGIYELIEPQPDEQSAEEEET